MNLAEKIKARKSCLNSCETTVTTVSGHSYKEKILADGTVITSQPQAGTSPGYVVDMKPDFQVALVLPGLCMGSQDVTQNNDILKKYSITHILSLGIKPIILDETLSHMYIPILDLPETNIMSSIDQCFTFIDNAIQTGECVFVHCNAGISRSAAVVIAYLMRKKCMSYQEAFLHLKTRRSVINPNPGFVKQLKDYEKIIKTLDSE
ncbi:Dual specificity protein phosphatase 19 [Cryptotermes secundus]|uniref:Dual specificity protein phosphatase 19 n=2 Tax=Cryptotermes secundus TaxID=105785 RepID=A0A2J7PQ24_9NEOP|nr:Dual specificity protein phosphatase 19 [Cryptotermes secundus]